MIFEGNEEIFCSLWTVTGLTSFLLLPKKYIQNFDEIIFNVVFRPLDLF